MSDCLVRLYIVLVYVNQVAKVQKARLARVWGERLVCNYDIVA